MNLNGTIAAIQPSGGYDGRNGHIFTFAMTISTHDGQQVTGEIGSKSQQYPMQVGSPICVESTASEFGLKFKKINPEYQQSQQQQQQPQSQPQQRQGPTPYDREVEGKCACAVIVAGIQSGQLKCEPKHIRYWVRLIMGQEKYPSAAPTTMSQSTQAYDQAAQQNDGCSDVDEIPF